MPILAILGIISAGASLVGGVIRAVQGDTAAVQQNQRDTQYLTILDQQKTQAMDAARIKINESAVYDQLATDLRTQRIEEQQITEKQFGEGGIVDRQLAQTLLELTTQAENLKADVSYQLGEAAATSAYRVTEATAETGYQIGEARRATEYQIGSAQRQLGYTLMGAAEQTAEARAGMSAGAAAAGVGGASVAAVQAHRQAQFQHFAAFQQGQFGALKTFKTGQLGALTAYASGKLSRLKTEEQRKLESMTTYLTEKRDRQLDVIVGREGLAKAQTRFTRFAGLTRAAQQQRALDRQITQAGISSSWATLASKQYTTKWNELQLERQWTVQDIQTRRKNRFWNVLGSLLGGVGGAVPGATMMAQNWPTRQGGSNNQVVLQPSSYRDTDF